MDKLIRGGGPLLVESGLQLQDILHSVDFDVGLRLLSPAPCLKML